MSISIVKVSNSDDDDSEISYSLKLGIEYGFCKIENNKVIITDSKSKIAELSIFGDFDYLVSDLKNLKHLFIANQGKTNISNLDQLENIGIVSPRVSFDSDLPKLVIISSYSSETQLKNLGNLKAKFHFSAGYNISDKQLSLFNLYRNNCSTNKAESRIFYNDDKLRIYKLRLHKARKIIIKLLLKNRIRYFFDRFLESRKDGISRYCYLANINK